MAALQGKKKVTTVVSAKGRPTNVETEEIQYEQEDAGTKRLNPWEVKEEAAKREKPTFNYVSVASGTLESARVEHAKRIDWSLLQTELPGGRLSELQFALERHYADGRVFTTRLAMAELSSLFAQQEKILEEARKKWPKTSDGAEDA